jgi:hypothetical protein
MGWRSQDVVHHTLQFCIFQSRILLSTSFAIHAPFLQAVAIHWHCGGQELKLQHPNSEAGLKNGFSRQRLHSPITV